MQGSAAKQGPETALALAPATPQSRGTRHTGLLLAVPVSCTRTLAISLSTLVTGVAVLPLAHHGDPIMATQHHDSGNDDTKKHQGCQSPGGHGNRPATTMGGRGLAPQIRAGRG